MTITPPRQITNNTMTTQERMEKVLHEAKTVHADMLKGRVSALYVDDWLRASLTTLVKQAFEEGRDIGMKADEALREEAIAQYQTEYEQKHIASAVEIARKEEQNKIIKLLQEKKLEYCGKKNCDQSHCATRHTCKIVIDDIINYIRS